MGGVPDGEEGGNMSKQSEDIVNQWETQKELEKHQGSMEKFMMKIISGPRQPRTKLPKKSKPKKKK